MDEHDDSALEQRIRDIIAVVAEDIDAITVEVEDGVAYIEGVVPSQEHRQAIAGAARRLKGLRGVITCLAVERVLPSRIGYTQARAYGMHLPTPVLMHYYSLS